MTQLLRTSGQHHHDWSADYRLYQSHLDPVSLFKPIFQDVVTHLLPQKPLILAVDDSNFGKRGKDIPKSGWIRDPLGPPFQTNLKWAQRFVQISAAVSPEGDPDQVRMIPVQIRIMDKVPKLKKDACEQDQRADQQRRGENSTSAHTLIMLHWIQQHMPLLPSGVSRPIILLGDGGYTTARLLQNLPKGVVYIGRARWDMHLHEMPPVRSIKGPGRPQTYGPKLPTPEEIRKDKSIPWSSCEVKKWGKSMEIHYKVLPKVKWIKSGETLVSQVLVIKSFRFKKRKNGPWCYKQPTCIICTDPALSISQIIQYYFLRWDIEVNFKEQKHLMGAGHAQVRHLQSIHSAPALAIAAYSLLHLAGLKAYGTAKLPPAVKPAKWQKNRPLRRMSTHDLLDQLQFEANMKLFNFSDFVHNLNSKRNPGNNVPMPNQRSNPL